MLSDESNYYHRQTRAVDLPKKLREEIGIKPGDKLAVTLLGLKKTYSLLLTKTDEMNNMFMFKIVSGLDEMKKAGKE